MGAEIAFWAGAVFWGMLLGWGAGKIDLGWIFTSVFLVSGGLLLSGLTHAVLFR